MAVSDRTIIQRNNGEAVIEKQTVFLLLVKYNDPNLDADMEYCFILLYLEIFEMI